MRLHDPGPYNKTKKTSHQTQIAQLYLILIRGIECLDPYRGWAAESVTGNCLFALYCSQRKEMEEQGPEENQALEIAVSVMTLSREWTVQQFYLSEAFLPQVVLFHQNPVLAKVTQCHHNTPEAGLASKQSHRIQLLSKTTLPPLPPAAETAASPSPGKSWTWPGWGNERGQATVEEGGKFPCLQGQFHSVALWYSQPSLKVPSAVPSEEARAPQEFP